MDSLLCALTDDTPLQEADDATENDPLIFLKNEMNMVLSSRTRFKHMEEKPLINVGILNYGITESVLQITDENQKLDDLKERIELAITRFEPRLENVLISIKKATLTDVTFNIEALFRGESIQLNYIWNHCQDRGYFHE